MDTAEQEKLTCILDRIESNLADNLMPFWATHAWDETYGGFLTRLDRVGRRLDDSEKILIMQVRMISSLASAHDHGLHNRGYLELAGKGFDFIVEHLWDRIRCIFWYSVTRDGKPKCLRKNTDFHGYALTGLSEYYRVSKRSEARDYAERVFDLLMEQAADRDKGFIEDFDGGEWPVLNSDQMNLGGPQKIKTVDMHTNVMEGLVYLSRITQAPKHKQALKNLLDLMLDKGIHPEYGCSITAFDYDWNPVADARGQRTTSYGLNVEIAWIMMEALDVLQESRESCRGKILGLVGHALDFGFDHERGGLAAYGPMIGRVAEATALNNDRLIKTWWAQAEMLNALIDVFEWTKDRQYLDAFFELFDWIWRYQIDHECGDWYQETHWDSGQPLSTDKGREWKTAFHASRALIRASAALRRIMAAHPAVDDTETS